MVEQLALSVQEVHAHYGEVHVLRGVSFDVAKGEVVAILGGNGAGKSTLLKSICGLVQPTSGTIMLNGQSIAGAPPHKVCAMGIGLASQGRQVFPRMTVRENLQMGAYSRRDRSQIATDIERMYGFFPVLRKRERQPAGNLSGGEQQMVAISRALMTEPSVLLLDEPSMGVAPIIVNQIQDILLQVAAEVDLTLLIVEQNAHAALDIANRAIVLDLGRISVSGTSEEVSKSAALTDAFLGGTTHQANATQGLRN